MRSLFSYLPYFLPAFIVPAAVEALVFGVVQKRDYNWRAALASLVDALGRDYVVYAYLPFGLALPLAAVVWQHRLTTLPVDNWTAFGLCRCFRDAPILLQKVFRLSGAQE